MKKTNSNRNALIVVSILVFSAIVFVSQYYDRSEKTADYLPIENIKIEGKFENLLRSDIKKTVMSVMRGGYFTVDLDAIRNALVELPWVEEASIRKQWPAGLTISVTEKRAIAYWGRSHLLSDKGVLFSPGTASLKSVSNGLSMPQLDGPDNLHKNVWVFLKETNAKIKGLDVVIKHLILDKRRSWEMQLSNDVVVKLGRENTDGRLQRFIKVFKLENAPKMQNIESMDLRYPNGFSVRMKTTQPNLSKITLVKEV